MNRPDLLARGPDQAVEGADDARRLPAGVLLVAGLTARRPDVGGVGWLELIPYRSASRRKEFTGIRNAAELVDPQRS